MPPASRRAATAVTAAAENRCRTARASAVGSRRLQRSGAREPSQNAAQSTWRARAGLVSHTGSAAAAWPVSANEAATTTAPGTSSSRLPTPSSRRPERASCGRLRQRGPRSGQPGLCGAESSKRKPCQVEPGGPEAEQHGHHAQGCQCRKEPVRATTQRLRRTHDRHEQAQAGGGECCQVDQPTRGGGGPASTPPRRPMSPPRLRTPMPKRMAAPTGCPSIEVTR